MSLLRIRKPITAIYPPSTSQFALLNSQNQLSLQSYTINHFELRVASEPSKSEAPAMASVTMTASFLAGAVQPVSAPRRGPIVVKAARVVEGEKATRVEFKNAAMAEEKVNGRRELVFAAATAAVTAFAGVALADDEPKSGTLEAKKKYSPVCVTMPTARICHK